MERISRLALRVFASILLLAYTLTFSLKLAGFYPAHLTWLKIIVVPGVMFCFFGSPFAGVLWLGKRWWLLFFPATIFSNVVLWIAIWWDQSNSP